MDEQLSVPLCEDDVCEIIAQWFGERDFDVTWLPAGKQGIDIDALHRRTGQRWVIEAKGATTSKRQSPTYGREYDQNGAYARVSQAYWMASRWTSLSKYRDANIGIAIPSTYHFDNHSRGIENACRLLGIGIFRVYPDESIEVLPGSLETKLAERFERPGELISE